jgi:ABC-type multidrug transport system fused ATPase/permease subunit
LWNLRKSLHDLFPTRRFRLILIGLVLIAAFISVSELIVARLFTQIILHEGEIDKSYLALLLVGFFLFYGFTRIGQFGQRIYRVRVFDRAFKANELELTTGKENWRWTQAFEITNIYSMLTQVGVVLLFFFYFNLIFAALNLLIITIVLEVLGRLFSKQMEMQRTFAQAQKDKIKIDNFLRVGSRIKSGEIGTLIAGFAMIILLGTLFYLNFKGDINASDTIVLFFGLRMQTSNLSGISTGLMRFARAKTHGE